MPQIFSTQRRVEFCDTDMAGIAHFTAFFRYMEGAEHALIRSLGLSVLQSHNGQTFSFPRVNATCDYRAPARCEDELEIAVSISRLGEKSVTYRFRISRQGVELAEGSMTSVFCILPPHGSGGTGGAPRSAAIPAEFVELLKPFVETPAG